MYLVDTSVWVNYLRGRVQPCTDYLKELLLNPIAVGLSNPIYMEILQGAKSQSAFRKLEDYFSGQQFFGTEDARKSHAEAARIYCEARHKGITFRSALDCLIAQTAVENNLILLHEDRDFLSMQKLLPALKQKHFLSGAN